jgi:hypothetical protein
VAVRHPRPGVTPGGGGSRSVRGERINTTAAVPASRAQRTSRWRLSPTNQQRSTGTPTTRAARRASSGLGFRGPASSL